MPGGMIPADDLVAQALSSWVGGARVGTGSPVLTTLATAVTSNSCPVSSSRTAKVRPGLAAGPGCRPRSWSGW